VVERVPIAGISGRYGASHGLDGALVQIDDGSHLALGPRRRDQRAELMDHLAEDREARPVVVERPRE
jgi:hypothetical protein